MKLELNKSPIPIVWLDTSVLINIAKLRTGKSVQDEQGERLVRLYDALDCAVQDDRILCPESEQRDELPRGRDAFRDTSVRLSRGIKTKTYYEIEQVQIQKHMVAYINNDEFIAHDYIDAFRSNPVDELMKHRAYYVDVDLGLLELDERFIDQKRRHCEELEKLRLEKVGNGISYEEELEYEKNGEWQALRTAKKAMDEASRMGKAPNHNHVAIMETYSERIVMYSELSGICNNQKGFYKFGTSEYYYSMPINDIQSRIMAKIITGDAKIRTGDSYDIKHASGIIPYSDVYITDRSMKHTICSLEIPEEYNCKVYYSGDSDEVIAWLESLNSM